MGAAAPGAGSWATWAWLNASMNISPENQALNERKLASAAENPLRYLEKHRQEIKTRADREIALFALLRLSAQRP